MFHQEFMKDFFLFEGLGKFGVSSQGIWAKSLMFVLFGAVGSMVFVGRLKVSFVLVL